MYASSSTTVPVASGDVPGHDNWFVRPHIAFRGLRTPVDCIFSRIVLAMCVGIAR